MFTAKIKTLILIIFLMSCFTNDDGHIVDYFSYDDEDILDSVYSDYKFPKNFYSENLNGGNIYYLNTLSIKSLSEREHISIELCTNDRDIAFNWSELSCTYSSYYRDYVSEKETEKYFEFKRVYNQNPSDIILFRAHKCSYLDRSMYDYFDPGTVIGKYNQRPFQKEKITELIEYLVFVRNYNNGSYKVLKSYTLEENNRYVHLIDELIIRYGDWGVSDRIELWGTKYTISKINGNITVTKKLIKTVVGRTN